MASGDNAGLRLLLVEDEVVLGYCLADMLETLGVQVFGPVRTVDDALAMLDAAPELDGAVLDVNLGSEVVFPVADRLRAAGVPFAFATGHAPDLMPPRFSDAPLWPKPLDLAAVRAMLAQWRQVA